MRDVELQLVQVAVDQHPDDAAQEDLLAAAPGSAGAHVLWRHGVRREWRPGAGHLDDLAVDHPGIVVDADPQCLGVRWALVPEHSEANQLCLDWEMVRVISSGEYEERVRRLAAGSS